MEGAEIYEYATILTESRELAIDLSEAALTGWEPFMVEQQFEKHGGFCRGLLVILRRKVELSESEP